MKNFAEPNYPLPSTEARGPLYQDCSEEDVVYAREEYP